MNAFVADAQCNQMLHLMIGMMKILTDVVMIADVITDIIHGADTRMNMMIGSIASNVKYKNLARYELVFIQCYPPLII